MGEGLTSVVKGVQPLDPTTIPHSEHKRHYRRIDMDILLDIFVLEEIKVQSEEHGWQEVNDDVNVEGDGR